VANSSFCDNRFSVNADRIKEIIERVVTAGVPEIASIKQARMTGPRLGIFASSFNPPTKAHVELIRRAAENFSLDEVLALAGKTNADKKTYECPLEDRIAMLELTFAEQPRISIGLSSHAFYVDILEALARKYPTQTDLHFIVGLDTFERVLDFEDQYSKRFYRAFNGRAEAQLFLFSKSTFIVAGRAGAGSEKVALLVGRERNVPADRVKYLDFPDDLGDLSATEVRRRRRDGLPIKGLAPAAVEKYIEDHALYLSQ
jgi:nicotinate (nicotinamide) nucleotide adenylyltransferase